MRLVNILGTGTLGIALTLTGSLRADDGIRVYSVPKETPSTAAPATAASSNPDMHMATSDIPVNRAKLTWTTPATWRELTPDGIRLGYFAVNGQDGAKAEVTIISFPGNVGTELENVNRWRNELQLPPIAQDQVVSENVMVDGSPGKFYEFGAEAKKTVVADVQRNGDSWFFKLRGDKDVVSDAAPVFRDFLKSIRFDTNAAAPVPPAGVAATTSIDTRPDSQAPAEASVEPATSGAPTAPQWTVPPDWTEKEAGPMILKAFTAGRDGKTASVAISSFQGTMGGPLLNVNRWRGQVGLPPVEEPQLAGLLQSVSTPSGPGSMVDFTGTDARTSQPERLIAVSLPHGDSIWFFKLTGDPAAVTAEKDSFVKFLQSAHLP